MKLHLIYAALLMFAATILPAADSGNLPAADAVVSVMLQRDAQRRAMLDGYCGMRRYVLQNDHLQKHAEMVTRIESDEEGTKHFEIVEEQGWGAAHKHVLHKMLDSEADASLPQMRVKTQLSPNNYEFNLIGTETLGGRPTYVVDITPKRHEERLFSGRIWIDAEDYALVRVDGKPAKNPSFWIRNIHFTHTYRKSGAFWFPASTQSVTDARLFGTTTVTITYFDYLPKSPLGSVRATAQSAGAFTH